MGTRIRTRITPRMRIISFVLAFVMVFVGLPYVGVELTVNATERAIRFTVTDTTSQFKDQMNDNRTATGGNYTYTGKYTQNNRTTLFDYVSDYELFNGYNNCYTREAGYSDAYLSLNNAISGNTISSPSSNNITFVYKNSNTVSSSSHSHGDSPFIYLWKHNGEALTDWNDSSMKMTWNPSFNGYTLTIKCSEWLDDQMYDRIIIGGSEEAWQTRDIILSTAISKSNSSGKSYTFSYDKFESDSKKYMSVTGPVIGIAIYIAVAELALIQIHYIMETFG